MLWSQSAPERRGQRAKSLGRAGGRGGQRSSWGFLHPWGPPHRLAAALAPIKQTAGKEHLLQESDGKLIPRLFPGPFLLPRLLAGAEGLSGVPRASAEILALISQTRKPSANSFSNGSGAGGCPGALLCSRPRMALRSVHVPFPRAALLLVPLHVVTQLDWLGGGKGA